MDEDTLSVQGFYILSTEMTNFNWLEFRADLEKSGRKADLEITNVREENCLTNGISNSSFAQSYYKNPNYRDYPVVNITHEAALLYCAWLTEKLNALPKPLGVNVKVRLPKHAELIRAGVGDKLGEWYPWCHKYLQNPKGEFQANCLRILNSQIARGENGELTIVPIKHTAKGTDVDLLAPVKSFWTNEFGMYNLSGNAAEMIDEPGIAVGGSFMDYGHDIRLQSTKKYTDSACDVGFRVVVTWESN